MLNLSADVPAAGRIDLVVVAGQPLVRRVMGVFEPDRGVHAQRFGFRRTGAHARAVVPAVIQTVAAALDDKDCIVSTTGMISRELFEYRTAMNQGHERDFLTVGSMGHASQIALGIALAQPERRVWCFDGDGAAIMHMGSMAIVANKAPKNYVHVVFNNGAHDSVGGQPTVGLKIDLPAVAKAVGYKATISVDNKEELVKQLSTMKIEGPVLLEIKVKKGNRKDLGRPTTTPIENKEALMQFLKK